MFQLFVEGHGEPEAAQKLVHKIVNHLGYQDCYFSKGRRRPNLHTHEGLRETIELGALSPGVEGILILRDDEDNCPAITAPERANFMRSLSMPFPIAYCILYREYETMFIAYSDEFAKAPVPHLIRGQFIFQPGTTAPANPEYIRGAKEWLTKHLLGRTYKPTTDQLSLTQAMDISILQKKGLACIGTLERCVNFLYTNKGSRLVYP